METRRAESTEISRKRAEGKGTVSLEWEMRNPRTKFTHEADPAEVQGAEPLDGGFGGCPPEPHTPGAGGMDGQWKVGGRDD